jgi:hypothetical protein
VVAIDYESEGPVIPLGSSGMFICLAGERPRLNRQEASEFFRQFLSDEPTLSALRHLLQSTSSTQTQELSDEQLVQQIAMLVDSGSLVLLGSFMPFYGTSGSGEQRVQPAGGIPPRPQKIQKSEPAPAAESPVFPPNLDINAMVGTIEVAARRGAAFCET